MKDIALRERDVIQLIITLNSFFRFEVMTMLKWKIHSCTADRLVVNECPSIHEKFRVNGTQSLITGCTGKPEMGSRMTSSGFNSVYSTPRDKLGY